MKCTGKIYFAVCKICLWRRRLKKNEKKRELYINIFFMLQYAPYFYGVENTR